MSSQPTLTPEQFAELKPEPVLRTMQIIAGALMMGIISFGAVVAFLLSGRPAAPQPVQPADATDPMILIAIVFTSSAVVARFVVPSLIAKVQVAQVIQRYRDGQIASVEEFFGRLMMVAQTKMIIEYALIEGVCFFNLIAVMTTRSLLPAGITVALLVLMAWSFPTKDKLLAWLEEQRHKLADV